MARETILLTFSLTCFLTCLLMLQRLLVFNPSKRIAVDEVRPLSITPYPATRPSASLAHAYTTRLY